MRLAILFSSLAALSIVQANAGIIVSVSPAVQTVSLGSTVTAKIEVSGLQSGVAPSLGAYDLNIGFNPAVLSFSGLTFGDPMLGDQLNLSGAGVVSDFSLSPGLLEFFEISLDPSAVLNAQQPGHFVLATLSFNTAGIGASSLLPVVNSIGDADGAPLSVGLDSASIQVVATPEPGTFGIFLSLTGLILGSLVRRRLSWHSAQADASTCIQKRG